MHLKSTIYSLLNTRHKERECFQVEVFGIPLKRMKIFIQWTKHKRSDWCLEPKRLENCSVRFCDNTWSIFGLENESHNLAKSLNRSVVLKKLAASFNCMDILSINKFFHTRFAQSVCQYATLTTKPFLVFGGFLFTLWTSFIISSRWSSQLRA